jgi:hypothetical protein
VPDLPTALDLPDVAPEPAQPGQAAKATNGRKATVPVPAAPTGGDLADWID